MLIDPPPWASRLAAALADIGLNEVGVAPGEPWQEVLPGCRSVLVFASGGPTLWESLERAIANDPAVLTGSQNPLDDFVAAAIRAADPAPPTSRTWVRCAAEPERFVDFRPLARDAGLGWTSRLGLLINPRHGPWVGLRAACFTTEALTVTGALAGAGPCDGCPAPCATACPVDAVVPGRFDIRACAGHRAQGGCPTRCEARNACPEGAQSRYPAAEQLYHDNRVSGRKVLADRLGVEGDPFLGAGPYWKEWSESP